MRVTLDTNVLIAAFISRGVCHDLFEHLVRAHSIVTSDFILAEVKRVMVEKFRFQQAQVDRAIDLIRHGAIVVEDVPLDEPVSRDPDGDWILSVAQSSRSHCLITGDDDLLSLDSFREIPILRPNEFWAFELKKGDYGS